MSKAASRGSDVKTDYGLRDLYAQRTYRVSARILEQFREIIYLVSPMAHLLWHLELVLYPNYAGKVKVWELRDKPDELAKLPPGFRLLDMAQVMRFNRDLARLGLNLFHPATIEELLAAKFKESTKFKKRLEGDVDVTK
jgi:hypothetical protein